MNILLKKQQQKTPDDVFFFLSCAFLEHRRDENIWILKHLQLSLNNNVEIEHFCCWNPSSCPNLHVIIQSFKKFYILYDI